MNTSVAINRWVLGDLEIDRLIGDLGLSDTKIGLSDTLIRPHIRKLLHSPTWNSKILLKRKEMLQDLSENSKQTKFVKHAQQHLVELSPHVEDTLWFLEPEYDEETEEYYGTLYFQGRFLELLNGSGWALSGTNMAKIYLAPLLTLLGPVISAVIPVLAMRWWGLPISLSLAAQMIWKALTYQITSAIQSRNPTMIGFALLYVGLYIWGLWSTIQTSLEKHHILTELRRRMRALQGFLAEVQKIQQHPYNVHFHNQQVAGDVQELLTNLQGSSSELYWFRLLTRKNPEDHTQLDPKAALIHKQLQGIVEWTQTLSGTLALSRVVQRPDYCLPQWCSNPTPAIMVENLRHTHLSSQKAVPNSIDLRRDLLITGPNQGGKSTFLKALLTAIWTAQTLGVVRAESYVATPFSVIYSYIGLTDEVGKESLFQAEMNSVQEYLETVQRAGPGPGQGQGAGQGPGQGFCIGFFDELFTSTNHEEGVSAALSVARKLGTVQNSMTLITTHFRELGSLDGFDKARFSITEDPETGKIKFHYRLLDGLSNQRVALRLMKERGFAPEIVNAAFTTLQQRFPDSDGAGPTFIPLQAQLPVTVQAQVQSQVQAQVPGQAPGQVPGSGPLGREGGTGTLVLRPVTPAGSGSGSGPGVREVDPILGSLERLGLLQISHPENIESKEVPPKVQSTARGTEIPGLYQ